MDTEALLELIMCADSMQRICYICAIALNSLLSCEFAALLSENRENFAFIYMVLEVYLNTTAKPSNFLVYIIYPTPIFSFL